MSRSKKPTSIESALHQINSRPNNLQLRTERLTPIHAMGMFGVAGVGFNTGVSEPNYMPINIGAELATSQPPLIATTIAATGALMYARRLRERQVSKNNSELQQVIRDALSEDVDIIKRDNVLNLRWYGADREWSDSYTYESVQDTAQRATQIAQFAAQYGIPKIAVGSSLFHDHIADHVDQVITSEFMQSKHNYRVDVLDVDVDETVFILSSTELTRAAELLSDSYEMDKSYLIDQLIDGVKDITIKRAYMAYQRDPTPKRLKHFTRTAATSLEPHLDNGAYNSSSTNEYGNYEQRRTTVIPRLEGRRINATNTWRTSDGAHGVEIAPAESLIKAMGYNSPIELYADFAGKTVIQPHERKHALTAIYLLGLDLDDDQPEKPSSPARRSSAKRVRKNTTLQAFDADGLKQFIWLRSNGVENNRLVYTRNRSFGYIAALATMYAAAISTGYTGGSYVGREANSTIDKAYSAAAEQFGIGDEFDKAYEQQLASSDEFHKSLVDISDSVQEMNSQLSSYMLDKYISIFGQDITDLVTSGKASLHMEDAIKSLPSDMYTSPSNKSMTGDVENSKSRNEPVYKIASLTGKPTEGYWFTDLYSTAYIEPTREIAPGAAISFSKSPNDRTRLMLPWKQDDIDALRADYMVSTPYINGYITLPVLQNGEIVAAAIVDKNNVKRRMNITIDQDSKTGTYTTYTPELLDRLKDHDINTPELRYYITLRDKPIVRHQESTTLDRSLKLDSATVANVAKKALGLSPSATNDEVFAAIKSKNYSYTPFKDSGITSNLYGEDLADNLEKTGGELIQTIAQLESLNCNLASALDLLATNAGGASQLQHATGFNNNGDDFLVQGEAHAWLIDKTSAIVDPTPANRLPEKKETVSEFDSNDTDYTRWGGILVATALTIMSARRRRKIIRDFNEARINYTLEHPQTNEAMEHIQAALYGRPNGARTLSYTTNVTREMLSNIPKSTEAKDVIQRRKIQGYDLSDQKAMQRAIRRALRTPR